MKIMGATGFGGSWKTFFDQSIGTVETNTFQLKFFI